MIFADGFALHVKKKTPCKCYTQPCNHKRHPPTPPIYKVLNKESQQNQQQHNTNPTPFFPSESPHHPQKVSTPALSETLSPKRSLDLLDPPINLHLSTIDILINRRHPLHNTLVIPLTLLEDLEHQIFTNIGIIRVAKVLVNALLEGLDTFAEFLGVMRMH